MVGPLYQGALELLEEDIDQEGIDASVARIPRPDPPSPWWWLLPPVMYLIRRHRGRALRQAVLAQLTQAQRDQTTSFLNKATGWFTVALGAAAPAGRRADLAGRRAPALARLAVLDSDHRHAQRVCAEHDTADDPRPCGRICQLPYLHKAELASACLHHN